MSISLNDAVNVTVEISPLTVAAPEFNVGLIIAEDQDVQTERTQLFRSLEEVTAKGFASTSSIFKAAEVYFSQSPRPDALVIGTTDAGADPPETQKEALLACRADSADWYAFAFADEVAAADMPAIAQAVEAMPNTVWFNWGSGAGFLTQLALLKSQSYRRTLSIYAAEAAAAVGIMGYAMGANSDTAPAYTLAYKPIVGATPEEITQAEYDAILAAGGNVYVTQGSYYKVFRNGKMANGTAFDDTLYLDALVAKLAAAVMNQLTTLAKVPQTEDGVNILTTALEGPCADMVDKGYIAPGVWNARKVLTLSPGDMLSKGYKILAESVAAQSQTDRDARVAPPIYVCLKTAGAIEHVTVGVVVNR
jgi:hypothetical protein